MTVNNDAARRAAQEAARRAAEEQARRRAQEAARKAAEKKAAEAAAKAAAKKPSTSVSKAAAQALSKQAGTKPSAAAVRQAFGKDELSSGLGRALRQQATSRLGAPAPSAPTPVAGRTTSLAELRAQAFRSAKAPLASADTLERKALGRGAVTAPSTGSVNAAEHRAEVSAAARTPDQRAAADAAKVEKAWADEKRRGGTDADAANAAAQQLRTLTQASADPAYKNALIRAAQPTLDKVTTVIAKNAGDDGFTGDHDRQAVKDSVRALSDVATASGEIGSFLIADQLAKKIPDESELMHVDDAFYEHVDQGGQPHLMAALASRLDAHGKTEAKDELLDRHDKNPLGQLWDATGGKLVSAFGDFVGAVGDATGAVVGFVGDAAGGVVKVVAGAAEMAVDVAKGTVELAGDAASWTTDQVKDAAEYAAKNGLKLAGDALNWVGDHARELAADLLDVDGQLKQLNTEGDTVTMAIGGSLGGAIFQGGAELQMTVTKTKDGYEMTLQGELSGGVFGGLSIPGFPKATGEANATGIASATMTFKSLDEVTKAAETVSGIGIAAAVGGPAGALLTGGTAGDEIRDITKHFTSGSVGLELSASALAELGETAGLGAGGSIKGTVTTGARLEITPGQPPALVLSQGIEAEGSLALGAPVEIPSLGGKLNGGNIDGSASITAETRVPLPAGLGLGDVLSDPVGSVKRIGRTALDEATTKLSIGVDISAGQATEGLPINFGEKGGIEVELSAEAKTKDIVGALGQALRGDLKGALTTLGTKTELDVEVNTYTVEGFNIDEEVGVPGFKIGFKAQDEVRDETDVFDFEGTPAELLARGFNLFDALQLKVS